MQFFYSFVTYGYQHAKMSFINKVFFLIQWIVKRNISFYILQHLYIKKNENWDTYALMIKNMFSQFEIMHLTVFQTLLTISELHCI